MWSDMWGGCSCERQVCIYLFSASFDDPVVSVKGGLVSHEGIDARLERGLVWLATEAHQLERLQTLGVHGLPLLDLLPRALVHSVVDRDDRAHLLLLGGVALAAHGVEEHLRRRVRPHAAIRRPGRDGGRHALRGERQPLPSRLLLVGGGHIVEWAHGGGVEWTAAWESASTNRPITITLRRARSHRAARRRGAHVGRVSPLHALGSPLLRNAETRKVLKSGVVGVPVGPTRGVLGGCVYPVLGC